MLAVHPAGTEPATRILDPQASPQAVAERGLRSSRYPALKTVSCDYQDGVLVLRGRLPSYYLKQIAQEVVAHQVKGVGRLDNQIQVVRAVVLETPPDTVTLGVLDTDEGVGESRRETFPDSDRRPERGVKITAPYGEEIEIDR
jgi:hypothetical protein